MQRACAPFCSVQWAGLRQEAEGEGQDSARGSEETTDYLSHASPLPGERRGQEEA
jgi:hypothetical protein